MEPDTAAFPEPEPDTAPISALAIVETYPAPPGILPKIEFKIVTRRLIIPVRLIISAIKQKQIDGYITSFIIPAFRDSTA